MVMGGVRADVRKVRLDAARKALSNERLRGFREVCRAVEELFDAWIADEFTDEDLERASDRLLAI
jgi:hypothetical protein